MAPYQILVSASDGAKVDALVRPVTEVVHPAMLACLAAESSTLAAPRMLALSFSIENKRLRHGRSVAGDDEPTARGSRCLLEHLDDKVLAGVEPLPDKVLIQFRLATEAAAPEGTDGAP